MRVREKLGWTPDWDVRAVEIPATPASLKDIEPFFEDDLLLAIQCQSRGWDKLAQFLLERSKKDKDSPPAKRLISVAFDYRFDQVTKPKIDRRPVLMRLKELVRRDPELETEIVKRVIKCLTLALVPSKAKPGSVEALIDGLVDYDSTSGTLGRFQPGEAYWKIADLGFEAVPALIEHLDDQRLTRAMMQGFNNFGSWHMCVRDVVGDLLVGLAGEELDRGENGKSVGGDWLRRQQAWPVMPEAAKKWWDKAQKLGEEKHLIAHVFPEPTRDQRYPSPNPQILRLIATRYPMQLVPVYQILLDKRAEVRSDDLAEAIVKSKLPEKEKTNLFASIARHKELVHRIPALRALKDLDVKQFNSLLTATLETLPKDVSGEYWYCTESRVPFLVVESDDPKVWAAFEKAVSRASVGLRMEFLNNMGGWKEIRRRTERLALLSKYLDDAELRDEKSDKRFNGPGAGSGYEKIEVRDFVALEIARLLEMKIEGKKDPTPKEWAKIRDDVREALKTEAAKSKK